MTQPFNLLPRVGSSMAEEWLDIGLAHHTAGRMAEAEQAYHRGLRVDPNCAPLLVNLGVMAGQQNNYLLCVQRLERATLFVDETIVQQASVVWYDYALALLGAERADEALPAIQKSIGYGESAGAFCAKGMILTSLGLAAEAVEAYDKALSLDPVHPLSSYNALFARTLKNSKPEDNYKARRRYHEAHAFKGEKKPHDNDKTPDRPLRVGYVGGDFKMHSAAFIFSAVILEHDKAAVEPYCYMSLAFNSGEDATTAKFVQKTTFRDIINKTDEEADAMIRADKIDILVDLSGHTGGNRLPLFTRKPAPIQCHAWGFAHGTGCPEIDYFLADPYAVPEEERQFFAEKIWDLPAIVGYAPPEYNQPASSPAPSLASGIFTFGVFGRYEKYSPQSIEAWHKILLRVPDSRLVLKDQMMKRPYVIKHVRKIMHDIDPKRILFMQDSPHTEQMLAYQGVDLCLDTFPHSGGVTALEMLYMGVPVITLYNGQVGGRTPAVALKAVGRKEWIATSIDEYVRKAVRAAENKAELAAVRSKLRAEMLKSPLCNPAYVRSVEAAYRQMWWRYCGHDSADSRNTGRDRTAAGGDGGVRHDASSAATG